MLLSGMREKREHDHGSSFTTVSFSICYGAHQCTSTQSLIDRVEAEAQAQKATAVHRLQVSVGELSGAEADLLITAYDISRPGTVCEHAKLEIVSVPALWSCKACQLNLTTGEVLQCPCCGMPASLVAGADVILDRIEMEVP